VNNLTV